MNALFAAAAEIQEFLQRAGERFCFIGAFAGRGQDWVDIESVAVRQSLHLDWSLVLAEFSALAEIRGGAEAIERLNRLRETVR